ncbi:hypothetical protein Ccrd_004685 [Cynara cardunculus var. scolymus]|uniref:DUF7798 domain-containing protein n=1 Tax=Cynara cardunculus var. scolymus TaxID=59895 RepID=A0A103XM39_CYNCS|nr:hypothetical protein Ccrd_004685 [Cynara cardunculus var. scolymus]
MEANATIKSSSTDEIQPVEDKVPVEHPKEDDHAGGGWGWGFSAFSVLSDLQKAAEEISRNAAEVAKTAANSISDLQNELEDSESSKEDHPEASDKDQESEDEDDKKRKAALEKLEKAIFIFMLQGIKAIDTSVENFASGAWQALGNAWKGGSSFVQKLENSIQQGGIPAAGSVTPSLLETGRAFTAKGMQVLEYVGKETVDLLITESGMEIDKNAGEGGHETEEDQLLEEVTFDRCFYIYGGPEQLEELEALSNHYALLFNRRKAKLSTEQKSAYDVKLKEVQQMLSLDTGSDGNSAESEKGKNVENIYDSSYDEIKSFHSSSVSKAAEMAAGFANALAGLPPSDIVQRTGGRLDSLHSEGIHRLSEMCCIAVSQLLVLGKSVIHNANKAQDANADEEIVKFEWPEDCIEKAKTIRTKTQSMTGYLEAVAISFVTGISDVAEAYAAAIKSATADSPDVVVPEKSIQDKVKSFSEDIRVNRTTAMDKIQEGLRFLAYVILSTSMPPAAAAATT